MLAKRRSKLRALVIFGAVLLSAEGFHTLQGCKKRVMGSWRDRCSGYRSKRSPILDALDPAGDFATVIEESHTRKRQIMSIREIIVSSRVPMYDASYPPVPPSVFAGHASGPIVPPTGADSDDYRPRRRFESLPQESSSDVGFDISYEEMIEMFNEVYERAPRATTKSKDAAFQEFSFAVFECCKNEQLCESNKVIAPCPW